MDDDRQELRLKVYRAYRRWSTEHNCAQVLCPWCEEPIADGFHVHEWLVKRSGLNAKHHDWIMVVENCVPMHPECHELHGQRVDATRRILEYAARILGADRIGRWYVGLWQECGLSVNKGLYREPYEIPLYLGREMFMEGSRLLHEGPHPESWTHPNGKVDVRDCAFSAIVTQKKMPVHVELAKLLPESFGGIRKPVLIEYAKQGYWISYLKYVVS